MTYREQRRKRQYDAPAATAIDIDSDDDPQTITPSAPRCGGAPHATHIALAWLFTAAAAFAFFGILLTASVFVRDPNQGVVTIGTRILIGIRLPDTNREFYWRQVVGPILVSLSVFATLIGNLVWLAHS